MKQKIRYWSLRLLYILGCLVVAFMIFIFINKYRFFNPYIILKIEKAIYFDILRFTSNCFPHMYIVHTLLLYTLAGYTVLVIGAKCLGYCIALIRRVINTESRKKTVLGISYFIFLVILLLTGLEILEFQYQSMGYFPGSFYPNMDFSQAKPKLSKLIIADERGMTIYDPDSFKRKNNSVDFDVNRQGFPNPFNFDKQTIDSLSGIGKNRKKKRLVIGDSFVEGMGALGYSNSFMEIYRSRNPGEVVCKAGIRGTDPVQYRLVAEKFIPEIRPDEVNIMFCSANDIMMIDRKPAPYIPLFTDIPCISLINYLDSGIIGNDKAALPPQQAYHLYRTKYSIMENNDPFAFFCRQSCITTKLYTLLNHDVLITRGSILDSLATYRNIKKIKDLADSAGAKYSIIFIATPAMAAYGMKEYEANYRWVFGDLWQYVIFPPKGMIIDKDCVAKDNLHFNDTGQLKFADFLQKEWNK